jgi:hypothetical protein
MMIVTQPKDLKSDAMSFFAQTGAAKKLIATMLATMFAAPERRDLKQ